MTRRRRFGAAVFGVALLSTLVIPVPAIAAFPGTNGKIVYQIDDTFTSEIWVMDADGTDQTLLTSKDDAEPAWSPDGRKIAFHSFRDGDAEIFVMNADGSEQTQLTSNADNDFDPTWSPSGDLIFQSDRSGDFELFTIASDGTDVEQLTDNSSNEFEAAWSPDGTKIAFETDRDDGADSEIYVMNANGTGQMRLTTGGEEYDPTWSPSGAQIAFHSERDEDEERHLYVMNANGTGQAQLVGNAWSDLTPAWSPDGAMLVFGSTREGTEDIYAMGRTGSNPVRLTNGPLAEGEPDWQPIVPDGPDTTILSGPKPKTKKRTAKFTFSSTVEGSTFECRLDGKPFGACTSPKSYRNLKVRKHTFEVRAIDGAGNPDPFPAKRTWKVTK
jgi:Tol biopolymer transport system component